MAKFFPSRKYKVGVNAPAEYPDEFLSSYGWALKTAEDKLPSLKKIPKDLLIANVLREKRNDFGASQSIFDPNSPIDKRIMENSKILYEAGGYDPPEYTSFVDKKGRSLLEMQRPLPDSINPEDIDKHALHALAVLEAKQSKFGTQGMLEGWNGMGISKFHRTGKDHANAVMEQKAALDAYPDMKEEVYNAFNKGYVPVKESAPIATVKQPSLFERFSQGIGNNLQALLQ